MTSFTTEGAVALSMVTPSCVESVAADVLCSVLAALSASSWSEKISRASTSTLAEVTVITASTAFGNWLSSDARKAATSKEATSPAATSCRVTTAR